MARGTLARIWLDQDPNCDEILQLEDGMLEERLEKSVAERIAQYAENYLLAHGREAGRVPVLSFHYVPIPNLTLQLPVMAVRECLDVALKNAVEASLGESAPSNAEVRIVVQASFNSATNEHSLDLTVENTSAPVAPEYLGTAHVPHTPEGRFAEQPEKDLDGCGGLCVAPSCCRTGSGRVQTCGISGFRQIGCKPVSSCRRNSLMAGLTRSRLQGSARPDKTLISTNSVRTS